MEVILAETAGFCMGVRRAVDMVLEVSKRPSKRIVTHGPLIHNPQVLELLDLKGIKAISGPSEGEGCTVVIRAHGVPPDTMEALKELSASLCDATCPHVLRAQNVIKKHAGKGYYTVIVGDKGHAEVDGLFGCAGEKGFVISGPEEVESLPEGLEPVCVVAQTTQSREVFDEACEKLKARYPKVEVFSTICSATRDRQEEVRAIAEKVDAMVIVGGRNSANTKRLAEIAEDTAVKTYLVEKEEELDLDELSKCHKVGITAGASTPYWMIDRVVETVRNLPRKKQNALSMVFQRSLRFMLKSNMVSALGAASVAFTASVLMFGSVDKVLLGIAVAYTFAMHIFNSYADRSAAKFNEPFMAKFYHRYGQPLLAVGVIASLISLGLSFLEGTMTFVMVLLATILGLLYRLPMNIKLLELGYASRWLRGISGSKDIFTAAAWSVVCVLIPFLMREGGDWKALIIVSIWTFGLVFNRSVAFDIKDLQGDSIVGKETLPIVLGKEKTKIIVLVFAFCQFLALLSGASLGWVLHPQLGYWLIGCVVYICFYLGLYHYRIITKGISFEILVDGSLLLPGILTVVWQCVKN